MTLPILDINQKTFGWTEMKSYSNNEFQAKKQSPALCQIKKLRRKLILKYDMDTCNSLKIFRYV